MIVLDTWGRIEATILELWLVLIQPQFCLYPARPFYCFVVLPGLHQHHLTSCQMELKITAIRYFPTEPNRVPCHCFITRHETDSHGIVVHRNLQHSRTSGQGLADEQFPKFSTVCCPCVLLLPVGSTAHQVHMHTHIHTHTHIHIILATQRQLPQSCWGADCQHVKIFRRWDH